MGGDMGHFLVEQIEQKQRVGEAGWIWQGVWPPSLAWEEGTHTHATAPIFTVPKPRHPVLFHRGTQTSVWASKLHV